MRADLKKSPPKILPPFSTGMFAGIVLCAAASGAGAVVFFFNPTTHDFYPVCIFHELTGLDCPGCGMTRAAYALLHGNFLASLKDNALFVFTLAAAAVWSARFAFLKAKKQPASLNFPPRFLWSFLVCATAFAVLRNLPGFEWLSP